MYFIFKEKRKQGWSTVEIHKYTMKYQVLWMKNILRENKIKQKEEDFFSGRARVRTFKPLETVIIPYPQQLLRILKSNALTIAPRLSPNNGRIKD